jgi:hypothetical protein
MVVVVVSVAVAMMVRPTIATPHHGTTNAKTEIEFTTRERMRMRTERPAAIAAQTRTRTRTRILSRAPKLVRSAHGGVLRLVLVPVQSVGAGSAGAGMRAGRRAIMALVVVVGGALGKTRGCVQMGGGWNRRVPKSRSVTVDLSEGQLTAPGDFCN